MAHDLLICFMVCATVFGVARGIVRAAMLTDKDFINGQIRLKDIELERVKIEAREREKLLGGD